MKYFKVTAKCGHVSNGYYIDKDFPVYAKTASEASQLVKSFPRVKKHLKYCITACIEITNEEFYDLREKNNNDGYFKAKNNRDLDNFCPNIDKDKNKLDRHNTRYRKVNYEWRKAKEALFIKEIRRFINNSMYSNSLRLKV